MAATSFALPRLGCGIKGSLVLTTPAKRYGLNYETDKAGCECETGPGRQDVDPGKGAGKPNMKHGTGGGRPKKDKTETRLGV